MEVHIPELEEGYHFDKIKKENPKTRWRLLFFFVLLAIIISGLILNGYSFDFSQHVTEKDNAKNLMIDQGTDFDHNINNF